MTYPSLLTLQSQDDNKSFNNDAHNAIILCSCKICKVH